MPSEDSFQTARIQMSEGTFAHAKAHYVSGHSGINAECNFIRRVYPTGVISGMTLIKIFTSMIS